MSKPKLMNFYVEGPDWNCSVLVDPKILSTERDRLIEAGTLAIEKQLKTAKSIKLGVVLIVKRSKSAKKEALVSTYICLINVGQYKTAENLRADYKKSSGDDLADDTMGYSY